MATNTFQSASNLSLKQLHYLIAVAKTLNFTQAAKACFVTQSTLSGGIQELERQLGTSLLERNNKHVMLTPIGHDVVARAQTLLSMGADLLSAVALANDPNNATLSLGAIPTIAPFLLPNLLRGLRQEAPHLKVLLREDQTDYLLQAVDSGALDAAIIALPMDIGRLHAWPLFEEELWLVSATSEAATATQAPTLRGLDTHKLMLLGEGHCLRDHTIQACTTARKGRATTLSDIEASSVTTLVQMVEAGLGLSMLPSMAIKAGILKASDVVARPFASPAPKRTVALVTRPTLVDHTILAQVRTLAQSLGQPSATGAKRSKTTAR